MKKLIKPILSLCICTIIYACTKTDFFDTNAVDMKLNILTNETNVFSSKISSGDITLLYEARNTGNSVTESVLRVFDRAKGDTKEVKFSIDVSKPAYKLIQHKNVLINAKKVLYSVDKAQIENLSNLFEVFAKSILNENNVNTSSQLIHSLFFHNAILNTIKRSKQDGNDCGCTPHPAYFIDKTAFWCQEDYLIGPNQYLDILSKNHYKIAEGEQSFIDFLEQNRNQKQVPIDKLMSLLEDKVSFMSRIESVYREATTSAAARTSEDDSRCFGGQQHGCCGNYEGCCWFSSIVCYVHDVVCINCTPRWFCLPGCVPG